MDETPFDDREDEDWPKLSASQRTNIERVSRRQFPASLWWGGQLKAKGFAAFARGSVKAVLYPSQSGLSVEDACIPQAELIIEGGYDPIPVFEVLQLPPRSGRFEMRLLAPEGS